MSKPSFKGVCYLFTYQLNDSHDYPEIVIFKFCSLELLGLQIYIKFLEQPKGMSKNIGHGLNMKSLRAILLNHRVLIMHKNLKITLSKAFTIQVRKIGARGIQYSKPPSFYGQSQAQNRVPYCFPDCCHTASNYL